MDDAEVKKLVNKIFAMKGLPKVTKFAEEFSDGGKSINHYHTIPYQTTPSLTHYSYCNLNAAIELFQTLFNILYEENINCRLVKSVLFDEKLLNWNRLNAQICFNYLQ